MSVFSDLLSEYITMKDVGVYPLSQFCGLDRSFMYKIINGKRNPSGEDVVRKMAQFMQLTYVLEEQPRVQLPYQRYHHRQQRLSLLHLL